MNYCTLFKTIQIQKIVKISQLFIIPQRPSYPARSTSKSVLVVPLQCQECHIKQFKLVKNTKLFLVKFLLGPVDKMVKVWQYFQLFYPQKYSLQMQEIETGTLYDCKPWETGVLFDSTNLLNNFKQNLHCYEQGFRKYTVKSRCELPLIPNCVRSKASVSQCKISEFQKVSAINKSTEIPVKLPGHKKSKGMLTKYGKYDENANKQNNQEPCTDRIRSKEDYRAKVFLINFEQQIKYKRLKKRQLHQVIFGNQAKTKRLKQAYQ